MTPLQVAEKAARASGELLRKNFGASLVVEEALHHDLKLAIDKEAQNLIFTIITEEFSEHALLGEEGIGGSKSSDYQWVVDPIDGTVNYYYGIPHYCVSIALRYKDDIIMGVIYDPSMDDLWTIEKGGKPYLNGTEISVSQRTKLEEAILYVGSGKTDGAINTGQERFHRASKRARKMRVMGSAALAMAYIASGRLDAYVESRILLWDIAAGKLLVEAAGGSVELTPHPTAEHVWSIVSTNGKIPIQEVL